MPITDRYTAITLKAITRNQRHKNADKTLVETIGESIHKAVADPTMKHTSVPTAVRGEVNERCAAKSIERDDH